MIKLDFDLGTDLEIAVDWATAYANKSKDTVEFDFNGIPVSVKPGQLKDETLVAYITERKRRRVAYEASAEGQRVAAEAAAKLVRDQAKIDHLVASLPRTIASRDEAALIAWLGDFAEINDHVDLSYPTSALHKALVDADYSTANISPEDLAKRSESEIYARKIMTSAISCFSEGMPLHPMVADWAKNYQEKFVK